MGRVIKKNVYNFAVDINTNLVALNRISHSLKTIKT